MPFRIAPLQDFASKQLNDLNAGLIKYVRASGLAFPEDVYVLDHIQAAVNFGEVEARLLVFQPTQAKSAAARPVGLSAWRVTDGIGYLLVLFVQPDYTAGARLLFDTTLDQLGAQAGLTQIHAELPGVSPEIEALFAARQFGCARRLIMQSPIGQVDHEQHVLPGYSLRAWQDGDFSAAATVIWRANAGTDDALIIPELRTGAAVREIVGQTLAGRYGEFDRRASVVVEDQQGQLVGVSLNTRRSDSQGFVAEICVLPEFQRQGLGRAMMAFTHRAFRVAGVRTSFLCVTAGNPARHLYESMGYRVTGTLWSFVWPEPDAWKNGAI